jgi:hypothetical protein
MASHGRMAAARLRLAEILRRQEATVNQQPPRLPLGTRPRRALKARRALAGGGNAPELRAALALVGSNYRVNQVMGKIKELLALPANRQNKLNNLASTIKEAIRLENPLNLSNQLKNKSLNAFANYAAYIAGAPVNSNMRNKIRILLLKLYSLKANMNATPNRATHIKLGKELGDVIGDIIHEIYRTRARGNMNLRNQNAILGAINSISKKTLPSTVSRAVGAAIGMYGVVNVLRRPGRYPRPEPKQWVIKFGSNTVSGSP